jgi:hypothetical protein
VIMTKSYRAMNERDGAPTQLVAIIVTRPTGHLL